jgi:hypothetical protein
MTCSKISDQQLPLVDKVGKQLRALILVKDGGTRAVGDVLGDVAAGADVGEADRDAIGKSAVTSAAVWMVRRNAGTPGNRWWQPGAQKVLTSVGTACRPTKSVLMDGQIVGYRVEGGFSEEVVPVTRDTATCSGWVRSLRACSPI